MKKHSLVQRGVIPALMALTLTTGTPAAWSGTTDSLPIGSLATSGTHADPPVDPKAPFTPKVLSLLAALTVDEKISLVHAGTDPLSYSQAGYIPGVSRLGIPPRRDVDALGINIVADATALPSRMGLGATFNRDAVYAAGQLEGNEGLALDMDLLYGPQIDTARQPNWSRNDTTFGEDPFLNGNLGIEEITGVQSTGLMDEVKHFSLYTGQSGAGFGTAGDPPLPTVVDEQTARELYLQQFEYAITAGHPSSVMDSYQGYQITPLQAKGYWSSDNALLLKDILRGEWKFPGFVLSDYGATHDIHALISGQDMEFATTYYESGLKALVDPTSSSYNIEYARALDLAVTRVLYAYERFGLLARASAGGELTSVSLPARPDIDDIKDADAATTQELSEKATVLLKNDSNILPLKDSALSSVAIIGPTGRQVMVYGARSERARGFPTRNALDPAEVLPTIAPKGSKFTYSPGIDWIGSLVPASVLSPGLTRTQSDSSATQVDTTINYGAASNLTPGVTYTWTGKVTVPVADSYYVWFHRSFGSASRGNPTGAAITIDGVEQTLISPAVPASTYPSDIVPVGGANSGALLTLTAGQHTITITATVPSTATQPVRFRFDYSRLGETVNAAVKAAKAAKVAVVFADDNGETNSELVNSLATNQDALISAVAAVNPNTVVVLSAGGPVLAPWIDKVKGVLLTWYPGQEGGTAISRILLGKANPGGRLPISWPVSGDQTPFYNHPERITGDGSKVVFSEGIYVGYRWYDQQNIEPLFPFGHGLSYTKFSYSGLQFKAVTTGVQVSFTVKNTGSVRGSESPQLYVGPPSNPPSGVQFAKQKLVGFDNIDLASGQSKKVTFTVSWRELSYWSTSGHKWVLPISDRDFFVGASSRDTRLNKRTDLVRYLTNVKK